MGDMAFKNDVADDMAPVRHSVWPRRAPRPAPVESEILFYFLFYFFGCCCREKIFRFSIPKIPEIRGLCGLRGRSREKKKVFSA
jgi:hypothetical protein